MLVTESVDYTCRACRGVSVPACGEAHAVQSFVGDLVRTWRSRSQFSHMRGVPDLLTVATRYGQVVAARVYHACCLDVVGRGLAMEC